MSRRLLVVIIIVLLAVTPVAYLFYGYSKFDSTINPGKPAPVSQYFVVELPSGEYVSLTMKDLINLTLSGHQLPAGSYVYPINVTGYITGVPEVDVNITMLSRYDRFTIIVGSSEVKVCSKDPAEFKGSCPDRTAAVSELSALTANLFKTHYYVNALGKGMDNASAKQYAYEETMKRYDVRYLSFMTRALIGLGRLGNDKHLAIILIGPAEGAEKNRIIVVKRGLVVLEGQTDSVLKAEVALIEYILHFKWPENNKNAG